jgi:hypothetical protein
MQYQYFRKTNPAKNGIPQRAKLETIELEVNRQTTYKTECVENLP